MPDGLGFTGESLFGKREDRRRSRNACSDARYPDDRCGSKSHRSAKCAELSRIEMIAPGSVVDDRAIDSKLAKYPRVLRDIGDRTISRRGPYRNEILDDPSTRSA